jgi:cation:H+ antiporter
MPIVLVIVGLVLLAAGGESLVRGAVSLARLSGLSVLLIGITVVAAATSMPELVVSLQAALAGNPGIVVGNVVGSTIANLALGLGTMGVLVPFTVGRWSLWHDTVALLSAERPWRLRASATSIDSARSLHIFVVP